MSARSPLRIAFLGSAARFSCLSLEAVASRQRVVGVVTVDPFWHQVRRFMARAAGIRPESPLRACARRLGVPVTCVSEAEGSLSDTVRALRPDLICIAVFPKVLGRSTLELPPLGAINAHPSLLPRHRGPLPLFWTYFCDDRQAGATIHYATERLDAGDIIVQQGQDLPRGYPAHQLDADLGRLSARLLAEAVDRIAAGTAQRTVQDEGAATQAPRIRVSDRMIPFEEWHSERVWHFLAGLAPRHREPLTDEQGRAVAYDLVTGYELTSSQRAAGTVQTVAGGWNLHCRDGIVMLSKGRA